jgi:plastocyanin
MYENRSDRSRMRLHEYFWTVAVRLNKLIAVVVIVVLVGLGGTAFIFGGTLARPTTGGLTTTNSKESQASSTSIASGNTSNSFYIAMNVIPTNRLIPLGGIANFTVVLYNGGDLTGNYSLSATSPSGLSPQAGAIPVAISGAGPHAGQLRISSPSEMSPGTYQVTIAAKGQKGAANQTFDFHVQRNLVQLIVAHTSQFFNLTVKAGDSVSWEAMDGAMSDESNAFHEVVFLNTSMTGSGWIMQYDSWSYTFTQPGIYRYYDNADRSITGEIIVLS